MKKFLMMSVLAMCIAAPAAMAEDKMSKDMMFDKMDANHDGKVSKEEHTIYGETMFTNTDTNNDGAITMPEMKAMKMSEHEKMSKDMPEKKM